MLNIFNNYSEIFKKNNIMNLHGDKLIEKIYITSIFTKVMQL